MSRDESSFPSGTGAGDVPGPGGPKLPLQAAEGITLRAQVLELINDVLGDTEPGGEPGRLHLRDQLAAHPNDPAKAFLEHLIWTRKPDRQVPLPASGVPHAGGSPAAFQKEQGARSAGMTKRVKSVLGSQRLLTAFQPILELPEGRVVGFEALTRFVTSDGADAETWFAEAEAVGLGTELELAALQCAVSAARTVPSHLFMAFNLSPATLTESRTHDVLQRSGLAMDKIVIELRGRADDTQWDSAIRSMEPLRHCGLRVAVDGSGPAFVPAGQILRLRPDIIKVDRAFINGIVEGDNRDEPAVMELAREVGAVLAGEGIETEAELAAVIDAGLTSGQGYLLGRPSIDPLEWSSWVIEPAAGASLEP